MKLTKKDDAVYFGGIAKSVPVGVNHPVWASELLH
jgi:type IV secretory pathway protease TraF